MTEPLSKIEGTVILNNVLNSEYYRRKSYISFISNGVICGLGILGYEIAIDAVS